MPHSRDNLENPGIFVRIMDDADYTIAWANGHGVVDMAYQEEISDDEHITGFLERKTEVHNIEQDTYDEWGTFNSTITLRSITLRESVHYLGRHAKICAFLRPKAQAIRFLNALEKGGSLVELRAAAEIRSHLSKFEQRDEVLFAEKLAEYLEEQLMNITSGNFEP